MRWTKHDYTADSTYFVTVVIDGRRPLLGRLEGQEVILSQAGAIVREELLGLRRRFPDVSLGEFIVMPDHIHFIIRIFGRAYWETDAGPGNERPILPGARTGLGDIMRALKAFSAKRINALTGATGSTVWQRNYYEHVIRSEGDYERIANYTRMNPVKHAARRRRLPKRSSPST